MTSTQPKRLSMRRLDPEFIDLPHYMRAITDRIWDGCRIGDINRNYSDPGIAIGAASEALLMQRLAGAASITIPLINFIVFFQKQIIGGLTQGAVKG